MPAVFIGKKKHHKIKYGSLICSYQWSEGFDINIFISSKDK